MDARQASDAFEKLPVGFGKIGGPTAAFAAVTRVAARRITQPRKRPLGLLKGILRDRRWIILFACVFFEAGLESEQCREPAEHHEEQQDRGYRNAEAHVLRMWPEYHANDMWGGALTGVL